MSQILIQIFIEERCFIRIEEFLTITAEHIFFLAVLKDFLGVKVVFEMGILFCPRTPVNTFGYNMTLLSLNVFSLA